MAFRHASGLDTIEAGKWEVSGQIIRETAKGILFDDGSSQQWLPKSKVRVEPQRDGSVSVFMDDWLAKEKRFV